MVGVFRHTFKSIVLIYLLMPIIAISAQSDFTLKSVVVDPFDGAGSGTHFDGQPIVWQLEGSAYSTEGYPRSLYVPEQWPLALFGTRVENPETYQIFGIQGSFLRPEFNQIKVIPGVANGDTWKAKPISLVGLVKSLDMWVWSANLNYTIEVDLRDTFGVVSRHPLYRVGAEHLPGSLAFLGWQDLYLNLGNAVPQSTSLSGTSLTGDNRLKIVQFIITTPVDVPVNNFYIYFDQLRMITDTKYDKFYDGYELGTVDKIVEVWGADVPGQADPATPADSNVDANGAAAAPPEQAPDPAAAAGQ